MPSCHGFILSGIVVFLSVALCVDGALHKPGLGTKAPTADAITRPRNSGEGLTSNSEKGKELVKTGHASSKEASRHGERQGQRGNSSRGKDGDDFVVDGCPRKVECSALPAKCLQCEFNYSCVYGKEVNVTCYPKPRVDCKDPKQFVKPMICQFCYQAPSWQHKCTNVSGCNAVTAPRHTYRANCTVDPDVLCMGLRTFPKNVLCNWTNGHQWSTAILLSITLGGLGADRFYLGHWQEGIGKLFSFGGLGVWTLVDVILIATRYLGPADGSLYI